MRSLPVLIVYSLITWLPSFASAQEMGPQNQELAAKWTNAVLPEVLESRRAGEEILYNGNLVDEKTAAAFLEADKQNPTENLSSLFNPKIYSSLQRQIKSQRLLGLIKKGQLVPTTYTVGENEEDVAKVDSLTGIYLELHTKKHPKPFAWGDTELHFSPSILDRKDFIISPYWDYGNYGPLAASAELNRGRAAFLISSYLPKLEQNEVVFLNEISFGEIKQIVVKKGLRSVLLKKIKAQKLVCPQQGGCEALIIER